MKIYLALYKNEPLYDKRIQSAMELLAWRSDSGRMDFLAIGGAVLINSGIGGIGSSEESLF